MMAFGVFVRAEMKSRVRVAWRTGERSCTSPAGAGRRPGALVAAGTVLGAGPWGSAVLPAQLTEPGMAFCSWKVQLSPLKSILRAWAELLGSSGHL